MSFVSRSIRPRVHRTLRRFLFEVLERREVFNTTPFVLASGNFQQNWSFPGGDQLTAQHDWSNVPSIVGYSGTGLTSATGVDPQTVLAENLTTSVFVNQTSTSFASGGTAEFAIADPVVAMQGSGSANAPNLVFYLDATGRGSIVVSYNLRDIDGTTDNAAQPVALQYRIGSTGNFVNVPLGFVADASTGPSQATLVTPVSVTLPAAADNQSQLQVRVITNNAVGNDEWIGVDDINITSSVFQQPTNPNFTLQTAPGSSVKAEGNSATTSYTFTVTRDSNTSVAASVDWAVAGAAVGSAAAASAADFAAPTSGTVNFAAGETSQQITVLVNGDTTVESDEGMAVTLSNPLPSGATIGSGQGTASAVIANDDAIQSLVAGDVVITAISTVPNPDIFTFVPLVDLVPGMTVFFTDNGWTAAGAAGSLSTVEGTVAFVVGPSGLAKGTKVEVDLSSDQLSAAVLPSTAGTATVSGSFALASTGDSLFAYTLSPSIPNMLFGVNLGSTYTPATFSNAVTFLPTGLIIGQSAVDALGAPSSNIAQSQYDHTPYYGSAAVLAAAVADRTNWVNDASTTVRIPINPSNLIVGPAAIVTPTSGLVTTETGGTASFTVVLSVQPAADVSIGLSSSDTTEGTVAPTTLTFTSANWNTPQTVTVTGVNDAEIDGNVAYSIVTSVTSSTDASYNNLTVDDVSVVNNDNDIPGVTVAPTSGLVTTESGGTASFTVVLASQPTANVTIALASDKPAEGNPSPSSLVFTAANWSVAQTVTVTGADDTINDGTVAYKIITTATSSDTNYNNLAVDDVSLTNLDDDRNLSALLNEVLVNPAATDNGFEYVELIGTPGSNLFGYYFAHFEGDSGTTQGAADFVVSLSGFTFGSNGLLMIKAPAGGFTPASATTVVTDADLTAGPLENGTVTHMLIYSPQNPIVETTDYDPAAGSLTLPSGAIVQDAVGWTDGGAGDIVYGGVTLTQVSGAADAASRVVGDTNPSTVNSWYAGDILDTSGNTSLGYDPANATTNLPTGAVITPGDVNFSGNQPPVVGANASSVSGNEGTTITNTGTWSDANPSDVVTLSASVGTVVKNANGTWSWSVAGTDDLSATAVTITANDGSGGQSSVNFTYAVTNAAPTVTVDTPSVSGAVLSTLTNTGTYGDVPADTVSLTASVGTIVKNANGTWSWSIAPTAVVSNQTVTITAADEDGGSAQTTFVYSALVQVTNKQFFYNNSSFESTGGVTSALDSAKTFLVSGATTQTTSFNNVSNYTRGINGAYLTVAGLASASVTAADFVFRVAPAGVSGTVNPSTWNNAPAPSAILVTAGTSSAPGIIQLEWADNLIQNTWLQIIVRANANTGLPTPAVFYLGHAQAEINGVDPYRVSVADLSIVQSGISTTLVSPNDLRDINKDRRVTVADLSYVQLRISTNVNLNNIIIPIAGSSEEGAGSGNRPSLDKKQSVVGSPLAGPTLFTSIQVSISDIPSAVVLTTSKQQVVEASLTSNTTNSSANSTQLKIRLDKLDKPDKSQKEVAIDAAYAQLDSNFFGLL